MEFKGQFSNFYGAFANIYALMDENDSIFYVGCTTVGPVKRLEEHLKEARSRAPHALTKKIIKIRELKYQISVKVLEVIWITGNSSYDAGKKGRKIENKWIRKFLNEEMALTNYEHTIKENKLIRFQNDYQLWLSKQSSIEQTA